MNLLAALTLGIMGSLHCIGMCGPIVIAIPFSNKTVGRIVGVLLYNIGRVISYSALGLLFGLFGKGLAMAGFQQVVSIVLGSLMLLSLVFPVLFRKLSFLEKLFAPINNFVKNKLGDRLLKRSAGNMLIIGILNGFLPCGLVYMAIAGAIASSSVLNGVLFMAVFGLGTIPVMAAIPILGNLFGNKVRGTYRKVLPYLVFLLGVIFILRGMNLGIKYISPNLKAKQEMVGGQGCH